MWFRTLLIISLLSTSCSGQICNFCSFDRVKEILKEEKIEYMEQINQQKERVIVAQEGKSMKSWYFRYNQCYMYNITVLDNRFYKYLLKFVESNYKKIDNITWEDAENTVELKVLPDCYQFVFLPKVSAANMNN